LEFRGRILKGSDNFYDRNFDSINFFFLWRQKQSLYCQVAKRISDEINQFWLKLCQTPVAELKLSLIASEMARVAVLIWDYKPEIT
jgi:hypothetical protein